MKLKKRILHSIWFSLAYLFIGWLYINQFLFIISLNQKEKNIIFLLILFSLFVICTLFYLNGLKHIWKGFDKQNEQK